MAIKRDDRVTVRAGEHKGNKGIVVRKNGTGWLVALDNGARVVFMGSSLKRGG